MAFPQSFMEELHARSDIVDVVSSYVTLTPKGGSFFGLCPFHSEKTPSFHVEQGRQMYYCFGCKKGGDVIKFIMDVENLPFPDAVKFLAKRAGLEVPEQHGDRQESRRRQRLLALNREAARFYHWLLHQPQGEAVRGYLARRQITRGTAVRFGMGASANAWDVLLKAMTERGYSKSELLAAGLIVDNKKGGFYDKFRNRLMLPVVDTQGNVVAFGSRILDGADPGAAKYMNSPETPVYSKRNVLYGLNLAKKSKRPNIILCEGNLDIVTLHQAGFDNAVASMGTALTQEQIRLLSKFTKELVLCYDNDSAGQKATEKALQLLNQSELSVKVLQLPRRRTESGELVKQDPDDFIKNHGPDAFERLLNGSENGVEFRMAQTAAQFDLNSDEGRVAYCAAVSEILAELTGSVEREVYTNRAAETARVDPAALKLEVQQAWKRRTRKETRAAIRREANPALRLQPQDRSMHYENLRSAPAEEGLLRLLLLDATLFPEEAPVRPEQFSSPLLGRAFGILWEAKQQGRTPSLGLLSGVLSPEEIDHISGICQKPESLKNGREALADYIEVVSQEWDRRQGGNSAMDPLAAAIEKNKKKGTGGKRNV